MCFAVSLFQPMAVQAIVYKVNFNGGGGNPNNDPHVCNMGFYWDGQLQPWTSATAVDSPNFVVGGKPVVIHTSNPVTTAASWTSGSCVTHNNLHTAPCWFTFDFGANPPPITNMQFTGLTDHWCFDSYSIQTSDDGTNWADLIPTTTSGIGCPRFGTVTLADVSAATPASATGDPHLQNLHGEKFDLMKSGNHTLIHIPRGARADETLLRVGAEARQLGAQCGDMYFQTANISGAWAEAKHAGGYYHSVFGHAVEAPEWVTFGKVAMKIVHGRTDDDIKYLNVYAKHLGRSGFAVGGLLGEDDHEEAAAPPKACLKRVSLKKDARGILRPAASIAVASLS